MRILVNILFLLLFTTCHSLSDNDEDFTGNREGGKHYHSLMGDDQDKDTEHSPHLRIPTMKEFHQLFAYPFSMDDSLLSFDIDGRSLTFPVEGYMLNGRQLVLSGMVASYLTSEGQLLRMRKGSPYEMVSYEGSYNSLRMVADQPTDGLVRVGAVYWKTENENMESDKRTYYRVSDGQQLDFVTVSIQ